MATKLRFDIRQNGRTILAVMLALLALNAIVLAVVVRPKVRDYRIVEEESKPRLERLKERTREVTEREEFLAALNQAETDLETMRTEVLATKATRLVEAQLKVAELAEQFNIQLRRVNFDNEELEDEGLERVAWVVPLEAGYSNLRRFIQAVEGSGEFLVIERVALDRARDGGSLLQLQITLATYFDAPHLLDQRDARRGRRGRA
jgi:hypothetical protein